MVLASYFDKSIITRLLNEKVNGFLLTKAKPEELKKAVLDTYKNGAYRSKSFAKVVSSITTEELNFPQKRLSLSPKYITVLELCLTDLTYSEIAGKMGITLKAVEGYRDVLFRKFNVKTKTGLVLFALKNGLIELK